MTREIFRRGIERPADIAERSGNQFLVRDRSDANRQIRFAAPEVEQVDATDGFQCDGARSLVRRKIGARLVGTDFIGRTQSTFIRAPGLPGLMKHRPAWATFSVNPRRCGNVYAIDGAQRWLVHNYLRRDELEFDAVDRDRAIREILGVGAGFSYEILGKEDWIARRLVANRFRKHRLFVCGDAAHIWVPMAGYGMNAGIADAANLAWLLAAHLHGWASAGILDAYERERLPITEQASRFAMDHALALQRQREAVSPLIEARGPRGEAVRATTGRALYESQRTAVLLCRPELRLLLRRLADHRLRRRSGTCVFDGELHPVERARLPRAAPWLRDGRSLYDAVSGPWYSLLRFDPEVEVVPLLDAARRRNVPLRPLDVDAPGARATYGHALVITRPDQHVAWRGQAAPIEPLQLIDRLRGALVRPPFADSGDSADIPHSHPTRKETWTED